MTEPIAFSASPDVDDWLSANWLVIRNRWNLKRIGLSLVLIAAFYTVLLVVVDLAKYGWHPDLAVSRLLQAFVIAIVVEMLVILLMLVLTPRRVRKEYADFSRVVPETSYEIDEMGVRSATPIGSSRIEWRQFKRWLEDDRVINLMLTDRSMFVLPKTTLGDDFTNRVRALLIAAGVPRR